MDIYSELFLKVLQILSEPLRELANPYFWSYFFLLPVIVFFVIARLLKPQRLIFRILLPIPIVISIVFAGIVLMQQVSGGFFGLMFVAEMFLITVLSIIVVTPCCGGMVLRGREKIYTLVPVSLLYVGFSFSHNNFGNFIENAIPLLIVVPLLHLFFLGVGALIGHIFFVGNSTMKTEKTPFLKDWGPLATLSIFLILWGVLFFNSLRVLTGMAEYGLEKDQAAQELQRLQPPPLLVIRSSGSGDTRQQNKLYKEGMSEYLVEKFDFTKQSYELFSTFHVDQRPGGAGLGTVSPGGNQTATFHNGKLEVFNADGDIIASYTTATSGIISWSPNARRMLLFTCKQFTDGCVEYSIVDLEQNTLRSLTINPSEVHWINDENIIMVTRGERKLRVLNVVNGSTRDLLGVFNSRYRLVIPSPDFELIAGVTPEGKIEICDQDGNVLSRPEVKDLITGVIGPYYFLRWSPDGRFFGIGRQGGPYGNVGLSSIVTRDGRAFNTPLYGQPREPIRGFWA